MILRLAAGFAETVPMAGVVPKLTRTPGSVRHVGPALGADTDAVLARPARVVAPTSSRTLRADGVIA